MSRKVNIFGGIKVWGVFTLTWPRKFSFKFLKEWDWAGWFWFITLAGLIGMGVGAVIIASVSNG